MNGGMTECGRCDCDPCCCEAIEKRKQEQRVKDGKVVAEIGIDVFSKVKSHSWKIKLVRWLWPDLQRLVDALYNYWDKT